MTDEHEAGAAPLRRAARIPLTVVVTATGQATDGILVAVMASDLDAYERMLWELAEFTAMVAGTAEAGWPDDERGTLGPDADALWRRITDLASHYEEGIVPDA